MMRPAALSSLPHVGRAEEGESVGVNEKESIALLHLSLSLSSHLTLTSLTCRVQTEVEVQRQVFACLQGLLHTFFNVQLILLSFSFHPLRGATNTML